MRKLPIAIAAAVAFDLGSFTVASAYMPSDIYLKIEDGSEGERGKRPSWSDLDSLSYRQANPPFVNLTGCKMIGGALVEVDGQPMCKVAAPKPEKPKRGLTLSVPLGGGDSGRSDPPPR